MKRGDKVRHPTAPDWGIGVVMFVNEHCVIYFEQAGKKKLSIEFSKKLTIVPEADIPSDSPLLDPDRWNELEKPIQERRKSGDSSTKCTHCNKQLRRSQYSKDRKWKSCPHCSVLDGTHHIFYQYPDSYGVSEQRENDSNADGAQSWCEACRQAETPRYQKMRCTQVEQA